MKHLTLHPVPQLRSWNKSHQEMSCIKSSQSMAGTGITSRRLLIVAGFVLIISRKPNPHSDLEYYNIIAWLSKLK